MKQSKKYLVVDNNQNDDILSIIFGKVGSIKFFISACDDENKAKEERERLLNKPTADENCEIEIKKLSLKTSQKIREQIYKEIGVY